MDFHIYQLQAMRTAKPMEPADDLMHAALGQAGEAGEFASAVVKFDNGSSQMVQFGKLEAEKKTPARVTPQISGNPEKFIKVAADSVRELRSVDVDRVLTETPVQFRAEVASYIRDQRKDLADEVDEVMAEIQPKAAAPAPAPTGSRRDPAKVTMFNPYEDGDIVTIDGQDWTVKQDTPGWYLTNTGNWRGTHPTIRNIKAMADLIRGVEQASVAQKAAAPQADTPKLTQAEAKALMEWQDMGQTDGIKKHALHFYESLSNKDSNRGRMTLVNVTKDTSASNWFVEGDDKPFAVLGMAKKRAEELGMLRAIADGFVEGGAEKAGADAGAKWDAMTPSQRASMLDKWAGAGLTDMGARYKDRAWSSFNVGERGTLASVINGANEAADEPAAGTKTDEQKAYQDSFEMPSQSVLAKKPTPASIDNWSNPVEWHGKIAYTNGHFVDVTGTPPHLKDWESRKGVRQNLTTSMTDRVLGMAGVRDGFPDSSHVKADPLAVIDDAKSGRLFFDVQGELVSIDLKYARYFHSKVKGVTFTANPKDLGAPLRVMDGDNLVGIVMPFRPTIYDKSSKMTVADVRGYMASSGKDKP